jgi:hypothetical protein
MNSKFICPCCNGVLEITRLILTEPTETKVIMYCPHGRCAGVDLNNPVEAPTEDEAYIKLVEVYEDLIDRNKIIFKKHCPQCYIDYSTTDEFSAVCDYCNERNILSERGD